MAKNPKSKHKHDYKKCLIQQFVEYGHKRMEIWYVGRKCLLCGKTKHDKWCINFPYNLSKEELSLPIVIDDRTIKVIEETNND